MPKYLNAHKLVAKTAMEMANELFEVYAGENKVYKALRQDGKITERHARARFTHRVAPMFFEDARKTLANLLGKPEDQISMHMKEEIYEALMLDSDLRGARIASEDRANVPSHLG